MKISRALFALSLFGFLLFASENRASALSPNLTTHRNQTVILKALQLGHFSFSAMDDPPPLNGSCDVTPNGPSSYVIQCCPPPGATGNCNSYLKHQPIEEDPPLSCYVDYIYQTNWYGGDIPGGYVLYGVNSLYEIDTMNLDCV